MFAVKRTLILIAVLALAISGLGVLSASASAGVSDHSALLQNEGGAWLGVQIRDTRDGATVEDVVAGSPADTAGLKVGDVIQSVDGEAVDSADQLVKLIQSHQAGDEVTLTVLTGSESREVSVTLGERPADQPVEPTAPDRPRFEGVLNFLGLNAEFTGEGLQIKSIDQDSPFADSGLQEGDVITAINGEKIDSDSFPGGWLRILRADDQPLTFTILHDGETQDIEVTIDWSKLGVQGGMGPMMAQPQPTQLGVRFRTVTAEIAQQDSLPVNEGAQVLEVYPNTPAEKAGVQQDDIITAVDGDAVDEEHTLADRLYAYEEGDTVTLAVQRGTDTLDLEVTLGPRMGDGMFYMVPGQDGSMMPYSNGRNGQGFRFQMPGHGGWFDFHFGQPDQTPAEPPAPEAAPNNPA